MKITQFKTMLARHGADFTRWEGVKAADARSFLDSSPEAQSLYAQARSLDKALDNFTVPQPRGIVLENVLAKIDGRPPVAESATVVKLEPRQKRKGLHAIPRPVFWGGALAACAAAVLVIFAGTGAPDAVLPNPAVHKTVVAQNSVKEGDVETLLAEYQKIAEEEIAAQQIIELWELASLTVSKDSVQEGQGTDEEIDNFLGQLYPASVDEL